MSEDSLIREVEDEVRREQLGRLWDRFGVYVLGICVLVIVGVGGVKLWNYYEGRQALNAGQQYIEAMQLADDGEHQQAQSAFNKIAAESKIGPRTLAQLQEAATKIAQNDIPGAVSTYDAVTADNSAPPVLRDLARVRAAFLLVDSAPLAEMQARVGELDTDENPWRNSAREMMALTAYRTGDLDRAKQLFSAIISDPQAPMGSRQRAQIVLSLVEATLAGKSAGSQNPAIPAAGAPAAAAPAAAAPAETSAGEAEPTPAAPKQSTQ